MLPLIFGHQITPKTSRNTRCSTSILPERLHQRDESDRRASSEDGDIASTPAAMNVSDPRPAARPAHPELVRPDRRRPGQQRGHPVDLAGGTAARRPAPRSGTVGQLHRGRGVRRRPVHAHGRLLPHRRLGPHRHHEQLRADAGGDRRSGGGRVRGRPERAELPVLHERLLHDLPRCRHRLHLDAASAPRQHRPQRRRQPHRHQGDGQREGSARRPAARGVRLRAAAHALERSRHAARGPGQLPGPRQLLLRLVRLRQRARTNLRPLRRSGTGVLRRAAHRRPGAERSARAGDDACLRGAERPRYVLAGVGHRERGRRAVQRVHAVGLQRRLLLRAYRLTTGATEPGGLRQVFLLAMLLIFARPRSRTDRSKETPSGSENRSSGRRGRGAGLSSVRRCRRRWSRRCGWRCPRSPRR